MFEVVAKDTLYVYRVFDVKYDKNGFPQFLVFKDRSWRLVSAKNFLPYPTDNR